LNPAGQRVAKAALLMMATIAVSRILGYGREVALYTMFGQNYMTDAYRAAFSLPDILYLLLVGGALSSAFIPVFSAGLATGKEAQAWKSASIVFNYSMIGLACLLILAYIYTLPLIKLLAPGLPPEYLRLAVHLTHIMFIQTFFMSLNGFAMGVLNSYHNFAAPALGSLVYNLLIIVMGVTLVNSLGIAAFSYGVVIGAAFNFVVQIPALRRIGIKYHFSLDYRDKGFRQILLLMLPVLIGLGVIQLNLLVTQNISSTLGAGGISSLNLAQKIMNLPIGIFATSIAVALFPTLTELAARGQMEGFKQSTGLGLRAVFLVSIPASLGLIAIGEALIKLLFEQGQFTPLMTATTHQALLYYCIGLFAYSAMQVLSRSFYALHDSRTPMLAALITIAVNIGLACHLAPIYQHRGLALAYSLAGIVNFLLLAVILRFKTGKLGGRQLIGSLVISMMASLLMYVAVRYSLLYLLEVLHLSYKLNLLVGTSMAVMVGIVVYGLLIYPFKLEETQLLLNLLRRKLPLA
jgi:putative peptidoglycan lipid II flippase